MYYNLFKFEKRLKKVFEQMDSASIFLVDSNPVYNRTGDQEYFYRPNSYMIYLIGFEEENSHLLLAKDKNNNCLTILFLQTRSSEEEIFQGKVLGSEKAKTVLKVDEAYNTSEFLDWVVKNSLKYTKLYYNFGNNTSLDGIVLNLLRVGIRSKNPEGPGISILEKATNILDPMRLIKDEQEIEIMKKSCEISAEAHIEAMKFIKPSVNEYEIENVVNSYFRGHGANGPAYPSICATGENATTLHYMNNSQICQPGQLFLLDAGCEFGYYSADITRTFPVNGKFTALQTQIYNIALKAQKAGIAACVIGNTYQNIHNLTIKILTEGLIELGILEGDIEKLIEEKKYLPYYPHGTGHWLGLDTHDVGGRKELVQNEFIDIKFVPGMIMTIEPGLYFSSILEGIPEEFKGTGVRIEDDVLITESGPVVLSSKVPKEISEIEMLMAKSTIQ